jgi:ABC-type lipopolysaccharide export system ATPase subunit
LSGGQRQQVAVGRALMTQPQGADAGRTDRRRQPIVMDELFDRIIEVARTGISILMVEQNARQALEIADKGYVLVQGANRFTDTGAALMADPEVRRTFFSMSSRSRDRRWSAPSLAQTGRPSGRGPYRGPRTRDDRERPVQDRHPPGQ